MSYNAIRKRNLYKPNESKPFKLSRSKVDLFLKCARCFYLDRRLGVAPPSGPPFTINSAVDTLLKKEFDRYREQGIAHPLMTQHGIDAIPFRHESLEDWRDALHKGVQVLHPATNLLLTGAVDDLWVTRKGEIIVVDYKATSKKGDVGIDADWQISYRRQMDFYNWLLKQVGFTMSANGYFVYTNALSSSESFADVLKFVTKVIAHQVDMSWIEETILQMKQVLDSDHIPKAHPDCEQCQYNAAIKKVCPVKPKGNKNERIG